MIDNEVLTAFKNRLESGEASILDKHNMALYCGIHGGDGKALERVIKSEILLDQHKDDLPKRIKLFQWPLGDHWYAKADNIDVVVKGRQKWNTAKAAHNAATLFLTSKTK